MVPTSWLYASITCLYKKGRMSVAANYRGLSIGANTSRILAKIIISRMKVAYETHISETQYGFRQNRSTSDGIFIVKTVIEKYGGRLIAVYIDLTAAYDHIPRDFLFRVLKMRTGASHLVAILQKMYEGTTASIRGMTDTFDVLIGCRQGGQESHRSSFGGTILYCTVLFEWKRDPNDVTTAVLKPSGSSFPLYLTES